MQIEVGSLLHVQAFKETNENKWIVSNKDGLVVFEPDFLISSTSVVGKKVYFCIFFCVYVSFHFAGAIFCKRRSVLSERYHGIEAANKHMVVGILVHQMLQNALKVKASTKSTIEKILMKMLKERDTVRIDFRCFI